MRAILLDSMSRRAPWTILALAAVLLVPACARVKPYQREHLARRTMTSDKQPGESRFEQHARGSREGADGGTGEAGGGCGCN
jgi:hypothetical protein